MIVIPMAGKSSRFFKEGFTTPKYELDLWGRPVLEWVLATFAPYFESHAFRFIVRADFAGTPFVTEVCQRLNIADFSIVSLEEDTSGQAETVFVGTRDVADDEELIIFNADSFHLGFTIPTDYGAGLLDVFSDPGEHWSFVEPGEDSRVVRTTEKVRISDLCSDGMYLFARAEYFRSAYLGGAAETQEKYTETYIAPLYNTLIAQGHPVSYRTIPREELFFCGTPDEYRHLLTLTPPSTHTTKG